MVNFVLALYILGLVVLILQCMSMEMALACLPPWRCDKSSPGDPYGRIQPQSVAWGPYKATNTPECNHINGLTEVSTLIAYSVVCHIRLNGSITNEPAFLLPWATVQGALTCKWECSLLIRNLLYMYIYDQSTSFRTNSKKA